MGAPHQYQVELAAGNRVLGDFGVIDAPGGRDGNIGCRRICSATGARKAGPQE
jgi:hypothetical protein